MMMSDLPADLVEEILSRVPATSLIRQRSTCKQWNTLFEDQRFTEKHIRNVPNQLCVLMLKKLRLFLTSVDLNIVPPSIEFSGALCPNLNIAKVSHCDGLLLCSTFRPELVVWNPCLGETRWIKQNDGNFLHKKVNGRNPVFALGYQENRSSCRSYKILMFWCRHEISHDQVDGFEIYDFNSNLWRVLNAPNYCFVMDHHVHGVTLKGNAYWIVYDDKNVNYLLSFDFTKERFRRLCFPLQTSQDFIYMALSVVREKFSVLYWDRDSSKMEMWVTNKMDTNCEVDLSWSKSFTVDYGFFVYSSLLIDEDRKVALCDAYSGVCTIGEEDEYYTKRLYGERRYIPHHHIFSYVPSLVRIQQGMGSDVVTTSGTAFHLRRRRGGRRRQRWY